MMPFLNISFGSTRFRIYSIINLSTLFLLLSLIPASLHAQVVQVGAGSYSTTLPSGLYKGCPPDCGSTIVSLS